MQLVERETSLQELEAAWQQARLGGCFVLVSGEAGIGKTTLVEQFAHQKRGQARMLWGACDALFTPRPLGPIYDMAAQEGEELARLLREENRRADIFVAFLQALNRGPTLAVFEDIHWADEATLDLLKYTGRRIQRTCALLIATYRDDEIGAQHPLRLLLGDLARSPAVRRIRPAPLSTAAIQQLAGAQPLDAAALQQQTGGNPFFITEALAAEREGIPATVRDAVLARAARLSLSGRAALNAAAVVGPRIEPWLLTEVTRAEARAVSESLEVGMLQAQGDVMAFRHELARQVILDEIPPHQRAFLHQAALDALRATSGGETDPGRLAHHAVGAGDREAILTYARAAGRAAASLGNHRAAADLFWLALEHASDLPLMEQIELNEAYALSCQGDPARVETLAAYRRALALARRAEHSLREGFELVRISGILDTIGQKEASEQHLAQALAILEPRAPNRGLIDAYRLLAMQHLSKGEARQALEYAEKSHAMALNTEQTHIIISAYQNIGLCWLPLDHQKGCEHLESCLRMALEHRQFWTAAAIYPNLVMSYIDVYNLQDAAALLEEALPFNQDHDIDAGVQMLLSWQAMLELLQGRWAEAAATSEALLEQPGVIGLARNPALAALGRVLARQGQSERAQALLDEALAQNLKAGSRQREGVYRCARTEVAWLAGDRDGALQHSAALYDIALQNRQPAFAAELAYWRWRCGEPVETHDWMVRPFVLEIEGHWQAAADAWQQLGCPYEQARALAQGDAAAQKEALLIFEQLGAQPMAERTRQQLRQAGVQTIPRGPRTATRENPFGLTNRQLQVLTLLTEQLTNAEIAARLHISPKTVDHHVSAILARLDVASREEAAARVQETASV